MIEYGDIESKNDKFEEDRMQPFKDCSDVEYPVNREAMVIKRSINVQIKKMMSTNKGIKYFILDVT
jgi:hypothetical protein